MPKACRVVIALSVAVLLLTAVVALAAGMVTPHVALAQAGSTYNTLRVYGRANEGAGTLSIPDAYGVAVSTIPDPFTGRRPEDAPYTDPRPIFDPQLTQAPIKDSITWNPLLMSEFDTAQDENGLQQLYNRIYAGSSNATEKLWFRMWYEPWHWDKDLNSNATLDIDPNTQAPYVPNQRDEWYPAVMQEFTYMLMQPKRLIDKPAPLAGPVGQTSFVFPVGMRKSDLFVNGMVPNVDSTSTNARLGLGLTSLDANFDGTSDIVFVESELTLFDKTGIGADFNGNGTIDSLMVASTTELNGRELAIFRTDSMGLAVNQALQFLDHMVVVKAVSDESAQIEVWYTGDKVPHSIGQQTLYRRDMLLAGRNQVQYIKAVANGGPGTNMCEYPVGPFFAYLETIDTAEGKARLIIGRGLGNADSGMENASGGQDVSAGDPWFLKRFYVDGHEYNVVAIKADSTGLPSYPNTCPLPASPVIPADPGLFKFITIRTPVPKVSTYSDAVQGGYYIEQHSVWLQAYATEENLSVMPPYNYEHYIAMDIRSISAFNCAESDVSYYGTVVGPLPPILQNVGPWPYVTAGGTRSYNSRREMSLFYVKESKNEQFLGELKEKYGETPSTANEFWYTEQFQTLPWEYTEFVLPDLGTAYSLNLPDLYLMTSSFLAPESQNVLWTQGAPTSTTSIYGVRWGSNVNCWITATTVSTMPVDWKPRAEFWFDPAVGGKKYKDEQGLRMYGMLNEGAGDETVTDPLNPAYPIEVAPYTDSWAPFNPQLPQAPIKDSVTFNPAYMSENNVGDPLLSLYSQLSVSGQDAREKVFARMWYEPQYWDKVVVTPTEVYSFPAVMQEFTYMFLDTQDQPTHGQPGTSRFAFPVATTRQQLPAPDSSTRELPSSKTTSFGSGVTTFDPDFDGQPDAVRVHSEASLRELTGIQADFDGNGAVDLLTTGMPGSEMVIFATPEKNLHKGDSIQFLDYMLTLENVSTGQAEFKFWYTGGGSHASGAQFPDLIGTRSVLKNGMAILGATRSSVRVLAAGGSNLGLVDGPWFVYLRDVGSGGAADSATVVVGRALGHIRSAIDNGAGAHDMTPGDPWYLKRYFVDGHEYNVVALRIEPITPVPPGDEPYEFKYITIRTPVPKSDFLNTEDSQRLQRYHGGVILGQDTEIISVMPPFNSDHTMREDIVMLSERAIPTGGSSEQFVFGNPNFNDVDCSETTKLTGVLQVRIVDEAKEAQFFGELREMYAYSPTISGMLELWQTDQFHTMPDQYTELHLPDDQKYLLTSNWRSEESRVAYHSCAEWDQDDLNGMNAGIPAVNTTLLAGTTLTGTTSSTFFRADPGNALRVKFIYDPTDHEDIYVNTWVVPSGIGTIAGTLKLQGRTNHSGAVVNAGSHFATTDNNGNYTLSDVPAGAYTVTANMSGYLYAQSTGVVINPGAVTTLPQVRLLGGDAKPDCVVNVFDLVVVGSSYGLTNTAGVGVDINGNGSVDLFDLVMVGLNLDKSCPALWAGSPAALEVAEAASVPTATLLVSPVNTQVEAGQLVTVTIEVQGATNVYGVDARLTFDPQILEVVDAIPSTSMPGVQFRAGDFPDSTHNRSYVGKQDADNQSGLAIYAITVRSPQPAASGGGTLCSLTFRAKQNGISQLHLADLTLVDPDLNELPAHGQDGLVRVGESNLLFLPVIAKSEKR